MSSQLDLIGGRGIDALQLEGQPLLDSLACNSQFPCNVGLGVPSFNQTKHDLSTFNCQLPSQLRVLDSFRSNLF